MQNNIATAKIFLICASIMMLSACSSVSTPKTNLVAQAYETSGVISTVPYRRTIFNSNNF